MRRRRLLGSIPASTRLCKANSNYNILDHHICSPPLHWLLFLQDRLPRKANNGTIWQMGCTTSDVSANACHELLAELAATCVSMKSMQNRAISFSAYCVYVIM
ncbi:unnamed protein product [Urochloa humidicola]